MDFIGKIRKKIAELPNKKGYLDLVAATLSIPVLLTVIITNVNNIKSKTNPSPEPVPENTKEQIIIEKIQNQYSASNVIPSPIASASGKIEQHQAPEVCKKEVGPIIISFPKEGEIVSGEYVCMLIKRESTDYCSVVWSYRINTGPWSEYNSSSPCLYKMPEGKVKFELRVQSTASDNQTILQRNFIYQNSLTPSPTSTSSAGLM